jgi:hypothetical protein
VEELTKIVWFFLKICKKKIMRENAREGRGGDGKQFAG